MDIFWTEINPKCRQWQWRNQWWKSKSGLSRLKLIPNICNENARTFCFKKQILEYISVRPCTISNVRVICKQCGSMQSSPCEALKQQRHLGDDWKDDHSSVEHIPNVEHIFPPLRQEEHEDLHKETREEYGVDLVTTSSAVHLLTSLVTTPVVCIPFATNVSLSREKRFSSYDTIRSSTFS